MYIACPFDAFRVYYYNRSFDTKIARSKERVIILTDKRRFWAKIDSVILRNIFLIYFNCEYSRNKYISFY